MSSGTPDPRAVTVHLPDEAFRSHPWDPERLATQLRNLWLVEQVRERRMSWGKAARLAEMSQARFLEVLAAHGVPVFDYDPGEIEAELGAPSPDHRRRREPARLPLLDDRSDEAILGYDDAGLPR